MTNLVEVEQYCATNARRRELFEGLVSAATNLRTAGCPLIYLDGSFVTGKPWPRDYDACWDPAGVDHRLLDPVFSMFDDGRSAQKAAFGGEFFPSSATETVSKLTFVEFFQVDRFTGHAKGILTIPLVYDPKLVGNLK